MPSVTKSSGFVWSGAVKDSIYAFTIMLMRYLAAIALGSRHVDRIAKVMPWKGPRNCDLA